MTQTRTFVIVILAVLSLHCGNSPGNQPSVGKATVFVEVDAVREGPISSMVTATGTITAKNEVKIIAQTEGKITTLAVEEGDQVKAGQLVVQLDASVLAAQTRESEATMEDARNAYTRARSLFETKLISDQEFDQARTRLNVARARHEYQKALLAYTRIVSPISGVVTYRGAREGDVAVPRTVLLTVSDPNNLVIEVTVSELEVPRISLGDPVTMTVDAYPGEFFPGKVRRIFPSSDPVTRLVKIEVQLTDRNPKLFPGLFARAELTTARRERATLIHNDALLTASNGLVVVFVIRDSVALRQPVELGLREGLWREVLSGVVPGEKVAISGLTSLNHNMAVKISRERTHALTGR